MKKDFDRWNSIKKSLHTEENIIKFQQRHIIFMKMGTNIGFEQDGKGKEFLRPVLVYKKFSHRVFLGIPLTSRKKYDKFHYSFEYKKSKESFAILSQIRLFDIKRAKYYDGKISKSYFIELQEKLLKLIVTPPKNGGECTKAICNTSIVENQTDVKIYKTSKIYIAGHRGLVGSAILRNLRQKGYTNLIYKTHEALDLTNQEAVAHFFKEEKPEYVVLAAAKVGGIVANNTYRADFIYENLQIQNNVIHQSYLHGVKKLLFLGSTCIYPKETPQPMKEESLLTSPLEYTNEPYAIAKIAGIKLCESYNLQYGTNFISVMPTNLYGPNDNFDLEKSHVLPALIRKMHLAKLLREKKYDEVCKDLQVGTIEEAKAHLTTFGVNAQQVEIWGSGKPRREFLYSEDMADACIFLLEKRDFKDTYNQENSEIRNTHLNIGTGKDVSIKELAIMIQEIVGFEGELTFNTSKPDGTMVKLTDPSKLHDLGWKHSVALKEGIQRVYKWYLKR
jgi:GDP-L-fucose synthase